MKFKEQGMGNIDTIWKHYGAGFQALKNWIIGRKNKNYLSGPNYNNNNTSKFDIISTALQANVQVRHTIDV